ncbi:MAG TPA: murein biosynthesis integral membrane protein MurJ, partial [Pseudolabrys sp.]|nr:murein biosynthesis integral membrane protein MurJ [Pseudolabrys sp.]
QRMPVPSPAPSPEPLTRAVATVGSATLVSRLLGFLRDVGIAAMLGTGVFADAFFVVLQVVNFFRRLLAEGALNAAFVPMWLRIRATEGDARAGRFFRGVFEAMALIAAAVSLLCVVFASTIVALVAPGFDAARAAVASDYLHIAAPYIALAAVIAVFAAVLNAEHRVRAVAFGIVVFNIVVLAALGWVLLSGAQLTQHAGTVLAQAIVGGGLAQFAVIFAGFLRLRPPVIGGGIAISVETGRFLLLAFPGLVAAGIPQLKLIVGAMIASTTQAGVSWLYYANRLYELPLGVASIVIASVIAPRIAASILSGDAAAMRRAQSRAFEIALGVTLPAAVGFATLAGPIAVGLFERGAFTASDSAAVAAALTAICAGLPGHVIEKIGGAISFAHEDTRTPMLAALAGLAVAVSGGLLLFPLAGVTGVAAAIAISGWVGATGMMIVLAKRGWLHLDSALMRRLTLIVLATAIMAATVIAGRAGMAQIATAPPLATVVLLVGIGIAVYVGLLQRLRVIRLPDLWAALRDKAR